MGGDNALGYPRDHGLPRSLPEGRLAPGGSPSLNWEGGIIARYGGYPRLAGKRNPSIRMVLIFEHRFLSTEWGRNLQL
jgi:hypothetical protein